MNMFTAVDVLNQRLRVRKKMILIAETLSRREEIKNSLTVF